MEAIDQFAIDLRDVLILHIALIFLIKENYMMSNDYIDSCEVGVAPEPDSEYWVAPFVQNVFDQVAAYNIALKVDYLIVTNGISHYCCYIDHQNKSYDFINYIPDYSHFTK